MLGAGLMALRLYLRLRVERRAWRPRVQAKSPQLVHGIPVTFGNSRDPMVDGVLRPRIWLPEGIRDVLSDPELDAVLLHELTHAKRRDNLIRLLHEIVLCLLWFHPLLWITNARLSVYRELSCDEPVIQQAKGGDLVSALAKLARPEQPLLLRATASSLLSSRLERLIENRPQPTGTSVNALLTAAFAAVLASCIFATIAHTACCFLVRK